MKVLILSTYEQQGGAAIAARRLAKALQKEGVDVKMLVCEKSSSDDIVYTTGHSRLRYLCFLWERLLIFLRNGFSRKTLFHVSTANVGLSITSHPLFKEADVIHLHWINHGMLSLAEIGRILKSGKKVIWTMHDMWPFMGIYHHSSEKISFENRRKFPRDFFGINVLDISIARKKTKVYSLGSQIEFVACSRWLMSKAEEGPLTCNHRVSSIPNPLDSSLYIPQNKDIVRQTLSLPKNKKLVLFVAAKVSDERKGGAYLSKASDIIFSKYPDEAKKIVFVAVGANSDSLASSICLPSISLGYKSQDEMPLVYASADLFVTPSLQENLPNTIMESMSCGVPCVGFDTGGVAEMIDHKINGYVADYMNAEELAEGIIYTLFKADTEEFSKNAREKVVREYSEHEVSQRYIDIYEHE